MAVVRLLRTVILASEIVVVVEDVVVVLVVEVEVLGIDVVEEVLVDELLVAEVVLVLVVVVTSPAVPLIVPTSMYINSELSTYVIVKLVLNDWPSALFMQLARVSADTSPAPIVPSLDSV